jgi:hypothetical protein
MPAPAETAAPAEAPAEVVVGPGAASGAPDEGADGAAPAPVQ